MQQIGAGSPLRLTTDPSVDFNPAWSPDGRWIAFLRGEPGLALAKHERELRLIQPLGGPEREVTRLNVQELSANPSYLTWCPDSKCLIAADSPTERKPDALFVVSLDTGEKRALTNPQPPTLADGHPSVSPDGKSLLLLRSSTFAFGELHVLPLRNDMTAAGEPVRLPITGPKFDKAAWTPNGSEILLSTPVFSGGASLWRVAAGGGQPSRLPFVGEHGIMPTTASAQAGGPARLVYVRSFVDENILRVDTPAPGRAASSPPVTAIASTRSDLHPQVSPDGRRIAFTSTRSGAWEIWVSDLDGSNAVQLTFLEAPTGTGTPRWSPDGRQIAFASDAEGQFDVFVIPSEGGRPRNLTAHPSIEHVPSFSRDGKWVYFSSARTGQHQVWKIPVQGGDAIQVTKDGGWSSFESPDGAFLYYIPVAAIGAPTPLWRMPTAGGEPEKILDGVLNSCFAVIETGIYYIHDIAGEARLEFYDLTRRVSTTVAEDLGDSSTYGGFAASPDGLSIFFVNSVAAVDDLMLMDDFQ